MKASLSTLLYLLLPSDTKPASVPASIAESFNQEDLVHATASESLGLKLFNDKTLELVSQLLDVAMFDQKFTAFKCDLDEKEAAI